MFFVSKSAPVGALGRLVRRRIEQLEKHPTKHRCIGIVALFHCSTRRRPRPTNAPTGALFDAKNVIYAPNNSEGRKGASMGRAHAAHQPPVCGMHVHDFNQLSLLVEKIQSPHTTKPVGWRHAACRELFRTGLKSV